MDKHNGNLFVTFDGRPVGPAASVASVNYINIYCFGGDDTVRFVDDGSPGNIPDATIVGGAGSDDLQGGPGNDVIYGDDVGQSEAPAGATTRSTAKAATTPWTAAPATTRSTAVPASTPPTTPTAPAT